MARRRKPTDPAAATRAALERIEREGEIARLKAQGADVTLDNRTGRVLSARRSNVFTLLLARGTITQNHHDAAYRLAQDWAAWKGLDGSPEFAGKVDGGTGAVELVTDRMIMAGRTVARTLGQLEAQSRSIMEAFMVATVEEDRPMAWRGIMQRLGVQARDRQVDTFVDAVEALRAIYEQPRIMAA